MDDIRDHDAIATPEENSWLESSMTDLVFRALALAGVALVLGVAVSVLLGETGLAPALVAGTGSR